MNETDFNDRIEKFTKAGITFGSNPNLFKVVAEGILNRSTYTLVAYVYMPKQDNTTKTSKKGGRRSETNIIRECASGDKQNALNYSNRELLNSKSIKLFTRLIPQIIS